MLPITVMKSNVFQASLKKFCSPKRERKEKEYRLGIHRAIRLAYTTVSEASSKLVRFLFISRFNFAFLNTLVDLLSKRVRGNFEAVKKCVCVCIKW